MPISKSQLKKAAAKAWADCFKENEATGERTLHIYGDDDILNDYLTQLGDDYEFVNHTGLRCHIENISVNTFRFSLTLVEVEYDDIKADTAFHDELDEDEEDYPIARGIETVEDDCSDSCGCAEETKGQLGALEENSE
jgi:hypothetical protein